MYNRADDVDSGDRAGWSVVSHVGHHCRTLSVRTLPTSPNIYVRSVIERLSAELNFLKCIYRSVEHELHYVKAPAAQQGYKTLTVACLNIKT